MLSFFLQEPLFDKWRVFYLSGGFLEKAYKTCKKCLLYMHKTPLFDTEF